jgi:hypothetical protein
MVFWQELGARLGHLPARLVGHARLAAAGDRPGGDFATAVLNQIRTLVAHLWENEGDAMTVTGQYLDSVNVPPPALLAPLWAPVGLRYHALHHLLPRCPIIRWAKRTAACARSWAGIDLRTGQLSGAAAAGRPMARSTMGAR